MRSISANVYGPLPRLLPCGSSPKPASAQSIASVRIMWRVFNGSRWALTSSRLLLPWLLRRGGIGQRGRLSLGFLDIRYVDSLAINVDERDAEGGYSEEDAPRFFFPLLGRHQPEREVLIYGLRLLLI